MFWMYLSSMNRNETVAAHRLLATPVLQKKLFVACGVEPKSFSLPWEQNRIISPQVY